MILDEILAHKRREVADRQQTVPLATVRRRAATAPEPRAFRPSDGMSLIAEVKRRSPSKGELVADLDPVAQARAYESGGASAISVLTDGRYFGGSFDDLAAVRAAVSVPVLCKDFLLTDYQIYEARAWGADLVLLIVAALDDRALIELSALARELGMQALVEVHDQHELARALAADATLIGINNRNLADFTVTLATTDYLAPLVLDGVIVVSESGIESPDDVRRVAGAGAHAILVGEALMRSPDPARTIRELMASVADAPASPTRATP